MPKRNTTAVGLFDIHCGPEHSHIDLKPVLDFIDDRNPDIIILGGDAMDCKSINYWDAQDVRVPHEITDEYEAFESCVLSRLHRAAPRARVTWLCGNHEANIFKWIKTHHHSARLAPWDHLDFKKYRIDWIEQGGMTNVGKLFYLHGDTLFGKYTPKFHAERVVSLYRRSVRYGHFHDHQEATLVSPIDIKDKHKAVCCGCLAKLNPEWMQNRPNRWINAFNYAVVAPDGSFNDWTIDIHANKFMDMNGKEYRP